MLSIAAQGYSATHLQAGCCLHVRLIDITGLQSVCRWSVSVVQASTDPEYQALLAKQAGIDAPTATQIAAGLLSQQQKEAGLASVFKRDDENLARR